jgi:hypothetical protein
MICNDCRIGGELNARGVALRTSGNVAKADETFDAADACHDKCRGCDCAHMTGVMLHD